MKNAFSVRRGALAGAAVVAALAAIPVSNAAASGTYVSTSGSSLLGAPLPAVTTTVPVSTPLGFDVVSTTPLFTLNVDPHMVH